MVTKKSPTALENARTIVETSGNRLHSEVVVALRGVGWTVVVSPYYSDNVTEKPREVDIMAEKKFAVVSTAGEAIGTFDARLLIECKHIPENTNTVFWFDDKDMVKAKALVHGAGVPYDDMDGFHYLADTRVAKLFASGKAERAQENEALYKAINQSLNATIYFRDKPSPTMPKPGKQGQRLGRVTYPLVVCSTLKGFFETGMGDSAQKLEPLSKLFQLEVNYAYLQHGSPQNEYFLIDVVERDQLLAFLTMLESTDISRMKEIQRRTEENMDRARGR